MEDFRELLAKDEKAAIRAVSREPFSEVLYYWKQTRRPNDKYKTYCIGIEQAVEKGRYSIHHLKYVKLFPEFRQCVYDGLMKYFLARTVTLIYKKNEPFLQIGKRIGMVQTVARKSLMELVEKNQDHIVHSINGKDQNVKIIISSRIKGIIDFLKELKSSLGQIEGKI